MQEEFYSVEGRELAFDTIYKHRRSAGSLTAPWLIRYVPANFLLKFLCAHEILLRLLVRGDVPEAPNLYRTRSFPGQRHRMYFQNLAFLQVQDVETLLTDKTGSLQLLKKRRRILQH